MDNLTQPDWPFAFEQIPDGTIRLAEVPQDSDADRLARGAVVMCTPRGHRDDEPQFGVTSPLFKPGRVDTERLTAEINQSDPGLDVQASEAIDMFDQSHRIITVTVSGE